MLSRQREKEILDEIARIHEEDATQLFNYLQTLSNAEFSQILSKPALDFDPFKTRDCVLSVIFMCIHDTANIQALLEKASVEAINEALVKQTKGWLPRNSRAGRTPLFLAACELNSKSFRVLLEKVSAEAINKALVKSDGDGRTGLHMVLCCKDIDAVNAFLNKISPFAVLRVVMEQGEYFTVDQCIKGSFRLSNHCDELLLQIKQMCQYIESPKRSFEENPQDFIHFLEIKLSRIPEDMDEIKRWVDLFKRLKTKSERIFELQSAFYDKCIQLQFSKMRTKMDNSIVDQWQKIIDDQIKQIHASDINGASIQNKLLQMRGKLFYHAYHMIKPQKESYLERAYQSWIKISNVEDIAPEDCHKMGLDFSTGVPNKILKNQQETFVAASIQLLYRSATLGYPEDATLLNAKVLIYLGEGEGGLGDENKNEINIPKYHQAMKRIHLNSIVKHVENALNNEDQNHSNNIGLFKNKKNIPEIRQVYQCLDQALRQGIEESQDLQNITGIVHRAIHDKTLQSTPEIIHGLCLLLDKLNKLENIINQTEFELKEIKLDQSALSLDADERKSPSEAVTLKKNLKM